MPKKSEIAVQRRVTSRAKRAGVFCIGVPIGHLFHFFECHRQNSSPTYFAALAVGLSFWSIEQSIHNRKKDENYGTYLSDKMEKCSRIVVVGAYGIPLGPTNSILLKKKGYCIGKSIHIPTHRKATPLQAGVHEKSFRLNEQDSFKLPSLFRDLALVGRMAYALDRTTASFVPKMRKTKPL